MTAAIVEAKAEDAQAPAWVFERTSRMGGAAGEAYTNTLAAADMRAEHVLAREAIQNSADAARERGAKVLVRFRTVEFLGSEKLRFVEAAGLRTLAAREAELKLAQPNCLASLDAADTPLRVLYVDDHETTGLEGDPRDDGSKFFRFLLSLGDGSKADEHGSGGSYGFGKSVYSSNSRILTIFAYSRTHDAAGAPQSLLFGCSYFRKHKQGSVPYSGRAWFGLEEASESELDQGVDPLLGDRADQLAATLGFAPRGPDDLGTSVLLIDVDLDEAELLRGVEDWWWPRLVAGGLDVEVVSTDGETRVPRPRRREDLRPFVEAFDVAIGASPAKTNTTFRKPYNKKNDKEMGVLGLRVLEKLEEDRYPVPDARVDAIALIREPRMVVQYYRAWSPSTPALVGAYVAAEDIDDVLKLAEPPAHNLWDPNAARLRDASGERREIVESVLRRIASDLKKTQKQASPPPPPRTRKLSLLERSLASFLTPSKQGSPPPPDPVAAPIALQYDAEPRVVATEDGRLRLSARFAVRLKSDGDEDEAEVRVTVRCNAVEDGASEGDPLALTTKIAGEVEDVREENGGFRFRLRKGQVARFAAESEPYDPNWTVRFVPEVQPARG